MPRGPAQVQSPSTNKDLMIGRLLNHFKILEQIGRGGMGEVFDTHSGGWSPDGKAVV